MKAYANWQVIWEVGTYRIVADLDGRYTLWTGQGPLVSYRGRNGLSEAYKAARDLAQGEVVYG